MVSSIMCSKPIPRTQTSQECQLKFQTNGNLCHLQRGHLSWESWAQCRFKCWAPVSAARPAAHEAAGAAGAAEAAAEAADPLAFFLWLGWQEGLELLDRMETLSPCFRFPLNLEAAELATVKPHRFPRFGGSMKKRSKRSMFGLFFYLICFELPFLNSYTAYSTSMVILKPPKIFKWLLSLWAAIQRNVSDKLSPTWTLCFIRQKPPGRACLQRRRSSCRAAEKAHLTSNVVRCKAM